MTDIKPSYLRLAACRERQGRGNNDAEQKREKNNSCLKSHYSDYKDFENSCQRKIII